MCLDIRRMFDILLLRYVSTCLILDSVLAIFRTFDDVSGKFGHLTYLNGRMRFFTNMN